MTTEPQTTEPEATDVTLHDFLSALYGATHDDFRLHHGDDTTDAGDGALDAAVKAAGAEPIYVSLVTANGAVPFLYTRLNYAAENAWADFTDHRPTAALYRKDVLGDGTLVCAFALADAAQADDPAVIVLSKAMGCDLTDTATDFIATPGANDWRLVHFDKTAITPIADLVKAYCDEPAAPVVEANAALPDLGRLEHATIRTPLDLSDPFFCEIVTESTAPGSKVNDWTLWHRPRGDVLKTFCRHVEQKVKDGTASVLGTTDGKRGADDIRELWFAGLDIDNGFDGDTIARRIIDAGLTAVLASTHSHMTTKSEKSLSFFSDWANANAAGQALDDEIMKAAMLDQGLEPSIVETMAFERVEVRQAGKTKIKVAMTHAPIQKWRVIVPLDSAFVVAENGATQQDGAEAWRAVPRALAAMLGDLPIDSTGSDVNRLFYHPAHREGSPWRVDVFGGQPLDWRQALKDSGQDAGDAAPRARRAMGTVKGDVHQGHFDARWAVQNGTKLMIADMMVAVDARQQDEAKAAGVRLSAKDRLITGKADVDKKVLVRCPFEEGHSKAASRPTGTFVCNPGVSDKAEGFVFYCSHDHCRPKSRTDFLNKMLADRTITAEDVQRACEMMVEDDPVEDGDDVDVEAALAEYAQAGGHKPPPANAKPKPAATTGYPLPKAAGKFELVEVDGRKFFSFPPDDEGKGGGLAFSRFTLVGGAVHPDRGNHRDVEIEFENEHGVRETMRIPADKIANKSALIAMMRDLGIAFGSAQGETVAHRILMMNQPTNHTVRDKTGWLEGRDFLLPTGVFLGEGDVRLSDIKRIDADPTAGTLEGWKTGAAAACAADSPSLHAGLLAGFAGPLTGLTGHATLVIAFTGSTTEGKTWRQQCGVAVSGPPEPGVGQMKSMNSTVGALEVPIERGSCTIAAFDELQHADAEEVQDLIFRATGQQGRARLSQSGGAGLTRAWRGGVVTLSTETSLAQQLRLAGARMAGGMTVRLIEVDVTIGRLADDEWDKANAMLANHGHALPVLIEEIRRQGYVENPSELGKRVKAFTQKLPDTDSPVAMRAATAIGYLCVGGEIAKTAGLLPMSFDVDAVGRTLWEGALGSGVKPEDPINRAIETLLESVNTRRHEIYEDDDDRFQTREAVAWVSQYAPTGEKVYCLREKFLSKWSGGAADEKALKKALLDRGIAIPRVREKTVDGKIVKSNLSVWRTWKKPVGTTPVIVLKASAIDGEEAPIPIGG